MNVSNLFLKLFDIKVYPPDSDIPRIHNLITDRKPVERRCPNNPKIKCSVNREIAPDLCITCPQEGLYLPEVAT